MALDVRLQRLGRSGAGSGGRLSGSRFTAPGLLALGCPRRSLGGACAARSGARPTRSPRMRLPPGSSFLLRCTNCHRGLLEIHTRGLSAPRVWDSAKISGRLLVGHRLRGDLAAELGDLRLDLVREGRELLSAHPQLLDELRGELVLLVEKLSGVARLVRGMHARESALEDIAGKGVLEPRETLEGLEA